MVMSTSGKINKEVSSITCRGSYKDVLAVLSQDEEKERHMRDFDSSPIELTGFRD